MSDDLGELLVVFTAEMNIHLPGRVVTHRQLRTTYSGLMLIQLAAK